MKIRKATIKDFEAIVDVEYQSGHPLHERFKVTKRGIRKLLYPHFLKGNTDFYIAKENKEIIGFGALRKEFSTHNSAEVVYLAVRKDFHGRGYGRKLMEFIEKEARRLGKERIFAYTGLDNIKAQKFYKKLGYEKINEFPGFYSWGDTAVLYGKWLKKKRG